MISCQRLLRISAQFRSRACFFSCGARRMIENAALENTGVQTPFLKVGDDMVSQAGCGQ